MLDRVEYSDLRGWILFRPRFHFLLQGETARLFPMKPAHGSVQGLQFLLEVNRY